VGRHQHDLGVGGADGVGQPVRQPAAEVGEGDSRAVGAGGEVGPVVGDPEDRDSQPAGGQGGRAPRLLEVQSGPDGGDAGRGQLLQGVG
jgi:hypothetical protein